MSCAEIVFAVHGYYSIRASSKSMKKNVVVFDGKSKFLFGGGQQVTIHLLKTLKDEYHLYLIECGKTPIFFTKAIPYVKKVLRLSMGQFKIKGGKTSYNLGFFEYATFPYYFLGGVIRTTVFLITQRLFPWNTILYSASKKSHFIVFLFRIITRYQVVAHIHTVDNQQSYLFGLLKIMYRSFSVVIVPSDFLYQHYKISKIKVIPNCTELRLPKLKNKKHTPFVVASISSLTNIKDVSSFLKSYNFLGEHYNHLEYWVVGDGSEKQSLIAEAQGKNIIFKGHVDDIKSIYDHIHLLVLPTKIFEAFGIVIIEAFSNGIPVITTNKGAQQELVLSVQKEGLVPVSSPPKIAEWILKYLNDPDLYNRMRNKVYNNSAIYSFDNFERRIKQVFKEI